MSSLGVFAVNPGGGGEAPLKQLKLGKQSRSRHRRCDYCDKLSSKCVPTEQGDPRSPCERCVKGKLVCTYNRPPGKGFAATMRAEQKAKDALQKKMQAKGRKDGALLKHSPPDGGQHFAPRTYSQMDGEQDLAFPKYSELGGGQNVPFSTYSQPDCGYIDPRLLHSTANGGQNDALMMLSGASRGQNYALLNYPPPAAGRIDSLLMRASTYDIQKDAQRMHNYSNGVHSSQPSLGTSMTSIANPGFQYQPTQGYEDLRALPATIRQLPPAFTSQPGQASQILLPTNEIAFMQNSSAQPPAVSLRNLRRLIENHHGMNSVTLAGHYAHQADQLCKQSRTRLGRVLRIMLEALWHEHCSISMRPPASVGFPSLDVSQVQPQSVLVGLYEDLLLDHRGLNDETIWADYIIQASHLTEAECHEVNRVVRIMMWAVEDHEL